MVVNLRTRAQPLDLPPPNPPPLLLEPPPYEVRPDDDELLPLDFGFEPLIFENIPPKIPVLFGFELLDGLPVFLKENLISFEYT